MSIPRSIWWSHGLVLLAVVVDPSARGDDPTRGRVEGGPPPPVQLTAQQDHRRIMDILHITSLRQGAGGNNPQAPNAANHDEAKANPHPDLPDPLVLKDGGRVTSAGLWWQRRRPEIVEEFDREIYGRIPEETPEVDWGVTGTSRETIGDVSVVEKTLVGHVDNSSYPPIAVDIQRTLTTPAAATGPVPVMMEFGFGGFGGRRLGAGAATKAGGGPSWQDVAGPGEYHWMAGNFLKYAGPMNWDDMPVDSHELVALCAPRPVFIGAGATRGDGWVDAKGMFLAAVGAGPVYKLLGRKYLGTAEFPPIETPLIEGDVAFRQHGGGHTPDPNWPTFLTFADRYIKGPPPPSRAARPACRSRGERRPGRCWTPACTRTA